MRRGGLRASLALFLSATLIIAAAHAAERATAKSAAERIAFYRARIGGPGTYPIYARLGMAYLDRFRETGKTRDWDEAVKALRQSLDYQPNYEAHLGLAMALSERHHFAEALAACRRSTARDARRISRRRARSSMFSSLSAMWPRPTKSCRKC